MAFHSSNPSRVWRFGARPPQGHNAYLIEEQFSLAHRYYNDLIASERTRRQQVEETIQAHSSTLTSAIQTVTDLVKQLEGIRNAISERNAQTCRRTGTREERAAIKALNGQLKTARAVIKADRLRLWGTEEEPGDPTFLARVAEIDAEALERQKGLRARCGCYWSSYLLVEKAWQKACKDTKVGLPSFRRWSNTFSPLQDNGILGVQLQGGLAVSDALAGTDTQLRLVMDSNKRAPWGRYGTVWLRVGSEGRNPRWAHIPIWLHRDLPTGAMIKWAVLVRRRVGDYHHYWLDLTMSAPDEKVFAKPDRATSGKVAVNLGWRSLGDSVHEMNNGSLRVGVWKGDDGKQGEWVIPALDIKERWDYANLLRSKRDTLFDTIKKELGEWLADHQEIVPEWLRTACSHVHQWRSQDRMENLLGHEQERIFQPPWLPALVEWRGNRFPGDESIYNRINEWATQERILHKREANVRRKAVAWRLYRYRGFVCELRRAYRDLVIADVDYKKIIARAKPEEKDTLHQTARFNRMIASPGLLASLIIRDMKPHVVKAPAPMLTQRCSLCGYEGRWDAAADVMHTCEQCGETFDQDFSHCDNLLSYEGPPAEGEGGDDDQPPEEDRVPEDNEEHEVGRNGFHTNNGGENGNGKPLAKRKVKEKAATA